MDFFVTKTKPVCFQLSWDYHIQAILDRLFCSYMPTQTKLGKKIAQFQKQTLQMSQMGKKHKTQYQILKSEMINDFVHWKLIGLLLLQCEWHVTEEKMLMSSLHVGKHIMRDFD